VSEEKVTMEKVTAIKPGLYEHYRGGRYTVIGMATHHETRQPMVLYVSHTYGGLNVRPLYAMAGDLDGWLEPLKTRCSACAGFGNLGSKPYEACSSCSGRGEITLPAERFKFIGDLPSDTAIKDR
jgi:hypothetical protein